MKVLGSRTLISAFVLAAVCSVWAGTAYAKADITVNVTGSLANGRVELRREGTKGAPIVASARARPVVAFRGVADGRYVVTAVAPGAVGTFAPLAVGSRPLGAKLSLRVPQLDRSRQVAAAFMPGKPLTVEATDASGVRYRLFLPGDALAGETTITLTPLAASMAPGTPSGRGVRIDPVGTALRREAELTVSGGGGMLRQYDFGYAAWLPVARDPFAGEGDYVVSALTLYAPAAPGSALRRSSLSYELARRDFKNAALEAAGGGSGLRPLLASSDKALRAEFGSFAERGCAAALDKRGLVVARAITSVLAGKKAPNAKRLKAAVRRCSTQARAAGTTGCRAAESAQDPAARGESRDAYLSWAFQAAKAYGIPTKPIATAYLGCVGYSVKAVVAFQRRTITLTAHTCGDAVAADWLGSVVSKGKRKSTGTAASATAAVQFAVTTDGARIVYWSGGNGSGYDELGPLVQQTWLTATPTGFTVSALVTRGDTVSETPSVTATIGAGTRGVAKVPPCGTLT